MTTRRCPVCARHVRTLITRCTGRENRSAFRNLLKANRSLDPGAGCCERCLTTAADRADSWYFRNLLKSEFALLPVPLRTDADPRFTGRGVVIAFIDSGFFPHPDLVRDRNRILKYVDVTDDGFGDRYFRRPHPESWHGTMSAVLACGSGALSRQIYRGIASEAQAVCVKVLNTRTGRVSERDIARGIQWVIDNRSRYNIRLLNIAVGGDKPQPLSESKVDQLVEKAVASGLTVVVAAGNTPDNPILPPASAPSAITVGGYDDHDQLSTDEWSMYHSTSGTTLDGQRKPDILGPATQLPGPLLSGTDQAEEARALFAILRADEKSRRAVYEREKLHLPEKPVRLEKLTAWVRKRLAATKYVTPYHKKMEGTSVAAGIVTSVAAQILEVHPGLQPAAVRAILLESAAAMKGVPAQFQGAGILNAGAAIRLALRRRHEKEFGGKDVSPGYLSLRYRDGTVHSVALAGEFNNWNPDSDPCHEIEDGVWSCIIAEPGAGSERYKLVLDGKTWIHDPSAPSREPDGFGGWNSKFQLPKKGE